MKIADEISYRSHVSEIRITISYEIYMRSPMRSLLVSITISYEISYNIFTRDIFIRYQFCRMLVRVDRI